MTPPLRHRLGARARTTVLVSIVVAVVLAVAGVAGTLVLRASLIRGVDSTNAVRVSDVAALAKAGALHGDVPSIGEETSVVQVVDGAGTVMASSPNINGDTPFSARTPSGLALQTWSADNLSIGSPAEPFRVSAQRVAGPQGPVVVFVATSLLGVQATLSRITAWLVLGLVVILLLSASLTWYVTGRALRPVEAAARRQRQLTGDMSHELRSPLSTLAAHADVALQHPDRADWPAVMAMVRRHVDRMEQVVEDLLLLADFDERSGAARREEVDLDDVLLGEADRIRAVRGRLRVTVDQLEPVKALASCLELQRALRNVVDNAARYARTTVRLGLRTTGDVAVIHVEDDGPGIDAADRERVFERFVRLDPSRGRERGGSGLGLAITREIVQRAGGQIVLLDATASPSGLRVQIRLPRKADR